MALFDYRLYETIFFRFFFSDVKTSKDTTFVNSRGRGRGGRSDRGGATRGRGAAAGSSNARNSVISQTGLFSQGAGDGTSKRLFRSFRGPGDSESSASSLRRPTISTKREKIDPIQEQKRISEIYDLDADSLDDVEMLPPSDNFSPLILRESQYIWSLFCMKYFFSSY